MPFSFRDVRSSLNHFIVRRAAELGYDDITILPGFSGIPQERPIVVVQSVPGGLPEMFLRHQVLQNYRFNIHFLTKGGTAGHDEAEDWIGHLQQRLMNNNWRITGKLVDWKYPLPSARYRASEGGLEIGQYYVSVAGISHLDEDETTLPSTPRLVDVTANSGRIRLMIGRYPYGYNWFRKHNLYIGQSPTAMYLHNDSPVIAADHVPTLHNLDDYAFNINEPMPGPPSDVKFRFIDVIRESFNFAVQPDATREAGNWMGSIFCVLRAPMTTATIEQPGPIEEINIEYELEE